MIYLDTHVVVWLYAGLVEKFNQPVRELLNAHDLYISPIVALELQYLFEIERLTVEPDSVIMDLAHRIGLAVCEKPFHAVVRMAQTCSWTRDPFDRLIVANAGLNDNILISKDQKILDHYPYAAW